MVGDTGEGVRDGWAGLHAEPNVQAVGDGREDVEYHLLQVILDCFAGLGGDEHGDHRPSGAAGNVRAVDQCGAARG
jgi:hypothetical protein